MRRLGWNKNLISSEAGNVGMIFAAMIIPTVMLIGGAVDYGDAINKKLLLQSAADAATLAAAKLDDDEPALIIAAAENVFNAKIEGTALEGVEPQVSFADSQVTLTVSTNVPTAFMRAAHIDNLEISARSVAQKGNDDVEGDDAQWGKVCMLALDPDATYGITAQGSKEIDLGNCWAFVNSDSSTSVHEVGNSYSFESGGVCTVGLDDVTHGNFDPAPRESCADPMADPFASTSAYPNASAWVPKTAMPTVPAACTNNGLNLKKGTYALSPGHYCGGIKLQAQAKVTFNPGIYVIDNGKLQTSSGSQLTGSNVVFYLYDSNTGDNNYPMLDIGSGSTVNLVGRHSGSSYQGFLVMQNAAHGEGQTSIVQGGGTFNMEGVLYLPTQKLELGGNGDMNGSSHYFMAVAKEYELRGSGHLHVKDHDGFSPLPNLTPDLPDIEGQVARLVE
ncbi:MAG: pilus assembly protein TadG-related protein [Hyphomicrobiaceae bacterium]